MQKRTYQLSFFSYLLVSFIVFAIMFGTFMLSSAYFSSAKVILGQIKLSQLDFQVLNSLNQIDTSETNLFMPDEVIDNAITILNARDVDGLDFEGLIPIYIRVKPILNIDGVDSLEYLYIQLTNPESWIQAGDGFLYCTQKLLLGDNIRFNDYFVLSYLLSNEYQDASVYLALEVDAVQSENLAYLDVWQTAPEEWKNALI
ncbi:MAG: hypothetical protein PHC46_01230 [Clostridia bacterium]|nr:hypothetical protein [Clostridia bacterium]